MKMVNLVKLAVFCMAIALPTRAMAGSAKYSNCAVIGDSIATIPGLGGQFPGCYNSAKIGIPSSAIIGRAIGGVAFEIISSGSNDPYNPNLAKNLALTRFRCAGVSRIVWVVPHNAHAASIVTNFAKSNGDLAISFRGNLHPYSYVALGNSIKSALGL